MKKQENGRPAVNLPPPPRSEQEMPGAQPHPEAHPDPAEQQAPPALLHALHALHRAEPADPRALEHADAAILEAADRRFAHIRRTRAVFRVARVSGVAAAAAALLLAAWVFVRPQQRTGGPSADSGGSAGAGANLDLDSSGGVDILDAFLLARAIESDRGPSAAWDFNADGAVDGDDVDLVAAAAVRIGKG